jgi:L-arabinokinase
VTAVFYVSGHGFGHAVRQLAIVEALAARRPEARLIVRSTVPQWLVARNAPASVEYVHGEVDTGAVQRGSLDVDVAATLAEAVRFAATLDGRADEEARWLASVEATLVVADIPVLACEAAARAGIPAIAIGNFTWDWIYAGYAEADAIAPGLADRLGAGYARAAEGWRLPMCGGFETFARCRDLPLVARVARRSRREVRAVAGLPDDRALVLVSLGGFGAAGIDVAAAARSLEGLADIVTTSYDAFAGIPGVHTIDERALDAAGVRYADLVAAVDIVASKPGYGIISDCAANGAALLYTSRGRFREYDVLVREMPQWVRAGFISPDAMVGGRWREAVARLLAAEPVRPAAIDGASQAADWLAVGTVPRRS